MELSQFKCSNGPKKGQLYGFFFKETIKHIDLQFFGYIYSSLKYI